MKGLELSEKYYLAYGKQMIQEKFPKYVGKIAVGLVGEGSECFGYDDYYSDDHDFGLSFCLWLSDEDYDKIGDSLKREYDLLPQNFMGFEKKKLPTRGFERVGVMKTSKFYQNLIGFENLPTNNAQWMQINENMLATVTNGKVFLDELGEFSDIRQRLLNYFPEPVRLKKIAANIALGSQAGQYNLQRCFKRNALDAANICLYEFINATIHILYLLNKKYMPFYKWKFKGLENLEVLPEVPSILTALMQKDYNFTGKTYFVEQICDKMLIELQKQGITNSNDDFLFNHVEIINSKIMG